MGILRRVKNRILRRKGMVSYWRSQGAKIGEGCDIHVNATLGSEPYLVEIGNHVRINTNVHILTHDGGVWVLRGMKPEYADADLFAPVKIGDNVHIGTGAMIMPGVTIGSNCIIGCDAVVTHDVPTGSVAVGVPARVIKTIEAYEEKNRDRLVHTKSMTSKEKREFLTKRFR
ncbi:MAG: acyltransferase [Oscillospiraceae bacterium]|nr:acyltransferase [Oscillospiraceae bacterium]